TGTLPPGAGSVAVLDVHRFNHVEYRSRDRIRAVERNVVPAVLQLHQFTAGGKFREIALPAPPAVGELRGQRARHDRPLYAGTAERREHLERHRWEIAFAAQLEQFGGHVVVQRVLDHRGDARAPGREGGAHLPRIGYPRAAQGGSGDDEPPRRRADESADPAGPPDPA